MNIRVGRVEDDAKKVSRYINVLRYNIQGELCMLQVHTVEEAYQYALKVEENLNKRQQNSSCGKSRFSIEKE